MSQQREIVQHESPECPDVHSAKSKRLIIYYSFLDTRYFFSLDIILINLK